jgi:hypothetical protein
MSDPLKKVKPGDPLKIPASTFNTFIDTARDFRARQQATSQQPRPGVKRDAVVYVRNNSGADRGRFDVLGINTPVFTPSDALEAFQGGPALAGVTPTAAHGGRFMVMLTPTANGAIGTAMIDGVCAVKVNVTDEAHAFADVADGQAGYLASGSSGSAAILWKESGTGQKWAIVRLGNAVGDTSPSDSYWMAVTGFGTISDGWDSIDRWTVAECTAAGAVISGGRTGTLVHGNRWGSSYCWPPHSSSPSGQKLVLRCWCIDEEHHYYACSQLTPPAIQAKVTSIASSSYEARFYGVTWSSGEGHTSRMYGAPFTVLTAYYRGEFPNTSYFYKHDTEQDFPLVAVGDIIPIKPVSHWYFGGPPYQVGKWMDATPRIRMAEVNGVWVPAGSQNL